jgi:hypothetical protein
MEGTMATLFKSKQSHKGRPFFSTLLYKISQVFGSVYYFLPKSLYLFNMFGKSENYLGLRGQKLQFAVAFIAGMDFL